MAQFIFTGYTEIPTTIPKNPKPASNRTFEAGNVSDCYVAGKVRSEGVAHFLDILGGLRALTIAAQSQLGPWAGPIYFSEGATWFGGFSSPPKENNPFNLRLRLHWL